MPQPIPDYVQPQIRDAILAQYPRGVKELSEKMGRNYITVLQTFKRSKHVSLTAWVEFCDLTGKDPDELTNVLDLAGPERRAAILSAMDSRDVLEAVERLGVNRNYVYRLLTGDAARKITELYRPLARALGVSLTRLVGMLQ